VLAVNAKSYEIAWIGKTHYLTMAISERFVEGNGAGLDPVDVCGGISLGEHKRLGFDPAQPRPRQTLLESYRGPRVDADDNRRQASGTTNSDSHIGRLHLSRQLSEERFVGPINKNPEPMRLIALELVSPKYRVAAKVEAQFAAPHESGDGSAPRRRESSVREDLTRIVVDRSGSWRAAWPGNWLGWSLATKVALGG
jgi:hypothetical protein